MNKELTPLKALERIGNIDYIYYTNGIEGCYPIKDMIGFDVIEKSLKDFEELKKGIAWRKAEYKKELDSGVDCDGIPLSETNRKIVLNLYNIMGALESYYKE